MKLTALWRANNHLPAAHPLVSRETISFADLDGEGFLVHSKVGFWMGMLRHNMRHAQIVEQADRVAFGQMVQTTELVRFVTNVTQEMRWRTARCGAHHGRRRPRDLLPLHAHRCPRTGSGQL